MLINLKFGSIETVLIVRIWEMRLCMLILNFLCTVLCNECNKILSRMSPVDQRRASLISALQSSPAHIGLNEHILFDTDDTLLAQHAADSHSPKQRLRILEKYRKTLIDKQMSKTNPNSPNKQQQQLVQIIEQQTHLRQPLIAQSSQSPFARTSSDTSMQFNHQLNPEARPTVRRIHSTLDTHSSPTLNSFCSHAPYFPVSRLRCLLA